MSKTGIVRDERYLEHQPGDFHPENPRRLEAIYAMLDQPDMAGRVVAIPCRRAGREELELIHSAAYVELVAATAGKGPKALDPDTITSAGSYEAALLAAGGFCEALDRVLSGALDNAFALVRPPGHHAERGQGRGFCLFNNVAIGARYAQQRHRLQRILVVDWDLHHGNGTQHSFEDDPSVLFFSTHQHPYYPGTGAFQEVGFGEGAGFTVNVPLAAGYGDADYVTLFRRILWPVAREFSPDLVLVSAGFDTYAQDPLGGMNMTPAGYASLTRILMDIAGELCRGRLVLTLEGGYNLQGLRDSVKAVLLELSGLTVNRTPETEGGGPEVEAVIQRVSAVHGRFWRGLSS